MKTIHQISNLEGRIKDNGGVNAVSEGSDIHKQQLNHLRFGTGNPTRDTCNRLRAFFGLTPLN